MRITESHSCRRKCRCCRRCEFIRLPPVFVVELAILCALLGLRLAVLGCMRERGGRAERGAESTLVSVSSAVPFPIPSPDPNMSSTPLILLFCPFLCCADACRPTERPIVRPTESSSSASFAPSSLSSPSPTGYGDADTRGFIMCSPSATVYSLCGVGLILDLAHVGGCELEGPPTCLPSAPAADQQERMLEVAGKAREDRQWIRVESALRLRDWLTTTETEGDGSDG
jgi:hypothetical protein